MIQDVKGWSAIPGVQQTVLLGPVGALRYIERIYPLRRLGAIAAERIRSNRIERAEIGIPVRLTTCEGERAATVSIVGAVGGRRAKLCLGVVFADEFYALLEGFTFDTCRFGPLESAVTELIGEDSHGLGIRRRRYAYRPPSNWQPLVRGLTSDWIPPGYPAEWAVLTVYPASPIARDNVQVLSGVLKAPPISDFETGSVNRTQTIVNVAGLSGHLSERQGQWRGLRVLRKVALLLDAGYAYAVELQSRCPKSWDTHAEMFDSIWKSILPLPLPRTAMFDDWRD